MAKCELVFENKCVQYIQNTINKTEIEKIEYHHKDIDAEGRRKTVIDMPEGEYMCGYHI